MKGPLYGGEQNKAFSHVVFLTLSSFAYVSAWLIVGIGSSDFWVEAPLPNGSGYSPLIIGLLLMYLVHKNMLVPLIRWIALAGWITVVAGSLVYAGFGIKARAEATIGPVLRAQPVAQDCHGRRFFRTCATTFALGDGTHVLTNSRSSFRVGRSCYEVRRVRGGHNFAWLRIVAASPEPGPGQLAWPIDRAECLSSVDLSILGR